MYRFALSDLIFWNDSKNRKPLIVYGARQVGKTYLVLDLFAKEFYKDKYIYVDCKLNDDFTTFCCKTADPKKIIDFLSLKFNKKIDKDTLLIFDEIQECPNIISSLKYFCQDYKYIPIIATGSMVRIKIKRDLQNSRTTKSEYLFPVGKINELELYPLTFDEYLYNSNNLLYDRVKHDFQYKKPLYDNIHQFALEEFYQYLLVGSMPEAVDYYLKTKDKYETINIIKNLYNNYLNDMSLYQASSESVVRSRLVYENIFNLLNRESKNFSPSVLEKDSRIRDFRSAIDWLTLSRIVYPSNQLKEHISIPFLSNDDSNFRLYLSDIGMFTYQSNTDFTSLLSNDINNTLSGIFYENFVADQLISKNHKLFYWKGKRSAEIEFILQSNGKIYPLDVKKGFGSLNSITEFSHHNCYEYAIKVSKNKYGFDKEKRILTLPFYDVPFFAEDLAKNKIE